MTSQVAQSVDVALSVWNRFWSEPMADGLIRAGYRVRVLGSVRRPPPCHDYRMTWMAGLLTQAAFRTPRFRDRLIEIALRRFERFAARRMGETRCLWGWSSYNLMAFKKALGQGVFTVLETGSTHASWAQERLGREFASRGLTQSPLASTSRIERMLEEYALVDRICVPSRFVEQTFLDYGIPKKKLHVNHLGVDVEFWRDCHPFATSGRPFTVLFTGQIMLRKGIAVLFDAWEHARLPGARLWLAGGIFQDARAWMRRLPEGVEYLGFLRHAELRQRIEQADLYVLPSIEDGFAFSVAEAMAAGLPVIVGTNMGVTDFVVHGEDGWVVSSGDSDALVHALQEAFRKRGELRELGESARRRVAPFTREAYGKRCASFLLNLIGPPRGR